ncbi:MAG TPA: hypothetical protein VND65_20415 [Candidatus Binatia bacterium]|nr:hypothetical protein [Candidatus Binatia bacterium]
MEALTQLVADSLVRHGLDRPLDPRRLRWSAWSRCDSPHSLLTVPSKPGIFAVAEEIMDFAPAHIGSAAKPALSGAEGTVQASGASAPSRSSYQGATSVGPLADSQRAAASAVQGNRTPAATGPRRMLAVLQFCEDDDMAFTLDRMFTRPNPMRSRLSSGACFLRFVVVDDRSQRRSICHALNQWLLASAEKASGLPAEFSSSLELSPDAGSSKNLHCPEFLPSGF